MEVALAVAATRRFKANPIGNASRYLTVAGAWYRWDRILRLSSSRETETTSNFRLCRIFLILTIRLQPRASVPVDQL